VSTDVQFSTTVIKNIRKTGDGGHITWHKNQGQHL